MMLNNPKAKPTLSLTFFALIIVLSCFLPQGGATFTPDTNCIFQVNHKLFILTHLQAEQPYQVTTHDGDIIIFNFCHAFVPETCPSYTQPSVGFLIRNHQTQCQPLSSESVFDFKAKYQVENRHNQERNVLTIKYKEGDHDLDRTLQVELACSEAQFYITRADLDDDHAVIWAESIHGCPVYQVPAMLDFLLRHRIFIAFITILSGFFFLFFGRSFFRIVAFLAVSCGLVILGCWVCFRVMEHDVKTGYLYMSLAIIVVIGLILAYLTVRFMVELTFFCLGAIGAFFIMGYFKVFVLSFFDDNEDTLLNAAIVYLVVTLLLMVVMGLVLLKSQQVMVIVVTAVIGGYLMARGASLIIGGFPPEYEVVELIESRNVSTVSLGFLLYLVAIVLLSLLGIYYQMRKLRQQKGETVRSSEGRVSSLYDNVDRIHQKIDVIINRNYYDTGRASRKAGQERDEYEMADYHAINGSR